MHSKHGVRKPLYRHPWLTAGIVLSVGALVGVTVALVESHVSPSNAGP